MSVTEYRAHLGFNQSTANVLLGKSPRHAWQYRNKSRAESDEDHSRDREIGTVTHALLLGATQDFVPIDAENYRTKAAQEARKDIEAAGKTPILEPDMARCRASCAAVLDQLEAFGLALDGESELPIFWDESLPDGLVLACKAQLDHIMADGCTILDIKTGADANPKRMVSRIIDSGLHVQAAAYSRALADNRPNMAGRIRFVDVFVETTGLTMVTPCEIGGSLLELGEQQWLRACRQWASCSASGVWPGYTDTVLRPEAPEWALSQELERQ